jgi:acetyl-CoA synthetase
MTTQTPHSVPSTDAPRDDYERLHREFRWHVPQDFNIAEACCGRWARDPAGASRVAVLHEREDGRRSSITYGELQAQANRLSHALKRLGARRGDRIAIVMPQRIETAVAQIAVQQIGAVAMPLSMLFGPDALAYRLHNSEARLAIADESGIDNLLAARPECHALATVLAVGEARGRGDVDWEAALARESPTPTMRPSSSTPAAPPGRPRERSFRSVRSSATCPASSRARTGSRRTTASSGARRTGPGPAA